MTTTKPRTSRGALAAGRTKDLPMPSSSEISVLQTKVDSLVLQGIDTNEALRSLTRAVTQLAVIEERQSADRQALDRAFTEITVLKTHVGGMDRTLDDRIKAVEHNLDDRVKALEQKAPVNDLSNGLVGKVVWLVVAAVIGGLMTVVLRAPSAPSFVIQAPTPAQPPVQQQTKPAQ